MRTTLQQSMLAQLDREEQEQLARAGMMPAARAYIQAEFARRRAALTRGMLATSLATSDKKPVVAPIPPERIAAAQQQAANGVVPMPQAGNSLPWLVGALIGGGALAAALWYVFFK